MPRKPPLPSDRRRTRSLSEFITQHEVFTLDEYRAAARALGRDPAAAHDNLAYHVRVGHLWNVRRGLYLRPGTVDFWVLASKLTDDAIISHAGALSFHRVVGVDYGMSLVTRRRVAEFVYNEVCCRPMRVNDERYKNHEATRETRDRARLRVSTVEQALVDCLEDLDRAPSTPVELLSSFVKCRATTSEKKMIWLATERQSPVLASRLGFFLQSTRPDVDDRLLRELERRALEAPGYFARRSEKGELIARWNLIVPTSLAAAARKVGRETRH